MAKKILQVSLHLKNYQVAAQNYLRRIEELVGAKVAIFSVGPDREQTILLKELF